MSTSVVCTFLCALVAMKAERADWRGRRVVAAAIQRLTLTAVTAGVFVLPVALSAQSASPTSLSWASVPVGGIGGQKVATLTNSGSAAITISSLTFTGTNPGDFKVFSKTCGSSLAAGASCTANITFNPTASGNRSATLNFNDSASNTPQKVTLTGYAPAASGSVTASPTSLSFGSVNVGSASAGMSST